MTNTRSASEFVVSCMGNMDSVMIQIPLSSDRTQFDSSCAYALCIQDLQVSMGCAVNFTPRAAHILTTVSKGG